MCVCVCVCVCVRIFVYDILFGRLCGGSYCRGGGVIVCVNLRRLLSGGGGVVPPLTCIRNYLILKTLMKKGMHIFHIF